MSTNPRNRADHDQPCLEDMIQRHGSVIGLAAFSGSGKTTLAEKLIAGLVSRGMDVATVKHAHHAFDADTPGKDSYRHRAAGARQVAVSSPARSVLFTENLSGRERSLADLLVQVDAEILAVHEVVFSLKKPVVRASKQLVCQLGRSFHLFLKLL